MLTKDDLAELLTDQALDDISISLRWGRKETRRRLIDNLWPRIEQELQPKTCDTCLHAKAQLEHEVRWSMRFCAKHCLGFVQPFGCTSHEPKP